MVANSVHIKGSKFRRWPNPCGDTIPHSLDFIAGLTLFTARIKADPGTDDLTSDLKNLLGHGKSNSTPLADDKRTLQELIEEYNTAHTDVARKGYALPEEIAQRKKRLEKANVDLLDGLHETSKTVDKLLTPPHMMEEVHQVLTLHFTTMLSNRKALSDKLAQGALKEQILEEFYFTHVRPVVLRQDPTNSASPAASTSSSGEIKAAEMAEIRKGAVWLALMFKLWSWFVLHDFNHTDTMIERTEYQDNRLAVYIG